MVTTADQLETERLAEALTRAAWPLAESTVRAYIAARRAGAAIVPALLLAHFDMKDAPVGSIARNSAERWRATLDAAWSREGGA